MRKILGTLRNHWKKSIFFGSLGLYGVNYGLRRREERGLMKNRCLEALQMGQLTTTKGGPPTRITVILNPAADSGKARSKYESYCAPLLHLAGVKVSVIRTEGMGQAKEIMGLMNEADAVLIAGGDGSLMESLTGLLRRKDAESYSKAIVLGVLPVGKENRLAKRLFRDHAGNDVDLMSAATMCALRKLFRPLDVLQVSQLTEDSSSSSKPLFALRSLEIGAFRDVQERLGKFWFFGPLKNLFAYVFSFSTSQKEINWDLNGEVLLSKTESLEKVLTSDVKEEGSAPSVKRRWPLSLFWGSSSSQESNLKGFSFKKIYNWISLPPYTGLELCMASGNEESPLEEGETSHDLHLRLGPSSLGFMDFVNEGWTRESSKTLRQKDLYSDYVAKAVRFIPGQMKRETVKFSLDNESIDLRGGLEVSILPNKIHMFCSKDCVFEEEASKDNENERAKALSQKKKWMQSSVRASLSSPAKLM